MQGIGGGGGVQGSGGEHVREGGQEFGVEREQSDPPISAVCVCVRRSDPNIGQRCFCNGLWDLSLVWVFDPVAVQLFVENSFVG